MPGFSLAQSPPKEIIPVDQRWTSAPADFRLRDQPNPRVFLTAKHFAEARAKAAKHDWAKAQLDSIIKVADRVLSSPVNIPDTGGQWMQHYICRKCHKSLTYKEGRHWCERCKIEHTGWPYDEVITSRIHRENFAEGMALGMAYQFTGELRYAARVAELLLGYAEKYEGFPIHNHQNKVTKTGGKILPQTLSEADMMLDLVAAADCVWASDALTDDQRRSVEQKLICPMAALIRRYDAGISNWQSFHNAAIFAAGALIGDNDIAWYATHGPSGFDFQMKNSILKDGFWYEGAVSYHFYALSALIEQAQGMENAGLPAKLRAPLKGMFSGPLEYMFPNGRVPQVNDGDAMAVASQAAHYEQAYAWFRDPVFAELAARGKRRNRVAFFYGAAELPKASAQEVESRVFGDLGAVMLRNGTTSNPLAVHFKYGPHGGGHGHFDKLGLIFFAHGLDAVPDPGRLSYAAPLHKSWYKTTVAHNTMVVDRKDQLKAEGRLVDFNGDGAIRWATATCDNAYADVILTRTVVLAEGYLLDIFAADSPSTHTYDLAWHLQGTQEISLPTNPRGLLGKSSGYQHIRNVHSRKTSGTWTTTATLPNGKLLRQTVLGAPSTDVIAGEGYGTQVTTCPMTLARRQGYGTVFITLIEPLADAASKGRTLKEAGGGLPGKGITLIIGSDRTQDTITLAEDFSISGAQAGQ